MCDGENWITRKVAIATARRNDNLGRIGDIHHLYKGVQIAPITQVNYVDNSNSLR